MMNAKEELLNHIAGRIIKCASITWKQDSIIKHEAVLKVNHTAKQLRDFILSLDFEYVDTYGTQELFGTVWLTDDSWLTRDEFEGMEWWEHHQLPAIPEDLL